MGGGRSNTDQARLHHKAGHSEEAQRIYQMGNALAAQGRMDQAIAHYKRALVLRPDDALTHNNLGNALADQGQLDAAIVHLRQAVRLNPGYAEAHANLANALMRRGALDEAVLLCRQAVALRPGYAEAHYILGNALAAQGRLEDASRATGRRCPAGQTLRTRITAWATSSSRWAG